MSGTEIKEKKLRSNRETVLKLVQTALLTAIIILMAFTPIGYLHAGPVEITFIMIPVVIGAILLGPGYGAFLGGVFGITSFIQCFGMSVFGATLLAINPVYTLIMCIVPRVLMGLLAGFVYKGVARFDKARYIACTVASFSGALFNTALFILSLVVFFGSSQYILDMMTYYNAGNFLAFAVAFVGINGLVEAIVCTVFGFAISRVLLKFLKKA